MLNNSMQLFRRVLDSEDEVLLALWLKRRRRKRKNRSCWITPFRTERLQFGAYHALVPRLSDEEFRKYFRVTRSQFEEIHAYIQEDITKQDTFYRSAIPSRERLAVCLRFLASGNSYRDLGYAFYLGESTISGIIVDVCSAIWKNMQAMYLPTPTEDFWKEKATEFSAKWKFPNCITAVDGKHVWIRKPLKSGSDYFCYKQRFSVILLAGADANYKFTFVDIGSKGRLGDAHVFERCNFGKSLKEGTLHVPEPAPLDEGGELFPYVAIGDGGFGLEDNLMTPYSETETRNDLENRIFNYRLSRARQTIECAFGILSARFRIFAKPLECKLDTVDLLIQAACVLHNYCRGNLSYSEDVQFMDPNDFDEPTQQFTPLPNIRGRRKTSAQKIRDKFCHYFNTVGSVSWQMNAVMQGKY